MFINCIIIENAYHGSVGGMATNTYGRVDQLEDRYLGMVEAPSSNLGTSTSTSFIIDFFVNFMTLRRE